MTTAQYQYFTVTQDIYREKAQLIVEDPDGGEFVIIFTNPANQEELFSEKLISGCTDWELRQGIKDVYKELVGEHPTVTLACYDNADVVQGSCNDITAHDCSAETCVHCKDVFGAQIDCTEYLAVECVTVMEVVCNDPLDTACVPVSEETT